MATDSALRHSCRCIRSAVRAADDDVRKRDDDDDDAVDDFPPLIPARLDCRVAVRRNAVLIVSIICVCIYVCEREREREDASGRWAHSTVS